ncbi:MAG TPA: twin-arginine translocase subunit TatC [Polyangiaceae bacterium]|nr:twin-arginine translocase subunit TatC [Polyangiaceae bacterium]
MTAPDLTEATTEAEIPAPVPAGQAPPGPPASAAEASAPPPSGDGDGLDPKPEHDAPMTIWEHLDELRKRLVRAALGVVVTTIVAWFFRTQLLAWLVIPYERTWQAHFHKDLVLQTLAPPDAFLGYLELSLVAGVVASAPLIFYQFWAFISPGLYNKEKRLIVPFVVFSTVLFLSGVAFAYYVAFPFTFNYFLSLLGEVRKGVELTQIVTLEFFLDFSTKFLLAFGAVFEMPLLIAFLVLANIVTPKQLWKFGRWATILAFILGAIVTPGPEVTSQIAVSGALIGLYFMSIPIAYLLKPRGKANPA